MNKKTSTLGFSVRCNYTCHTFKSHFYLGAPSNATFKNTLLSGTVGSVFIMSF